MGSLLEVHREINGSFQKVGSLLGDSSGIRFSYDDAYIQRPGAASISTTFPIDRKEFSAVETRMFFDGLLPEGPLRQQFNDAFHSPEENYLTLLARLNFETAGALVFCEEGADLGQSRSYLPLDYADLCTFAARPLPAAFDMDTASRLSLAGAQLKIGLMHSGDDPVKGWNQPLDAAPSTHILKASNGVFEGQTVNEALCMRMASLLEFDAAECRLIPVEGAEPLLAVERFDRVWTPGERFPERLHQEDLAQVLELAGYLKYEPTDGHYASLIAGAIDRISANPFGDRVFLFRRLLFDWLVGNCDNHLKNHSFVWSPDWSQRELAPLYDVTCTTFYPSLDREMGVSLCESRRVDDVTPSDLESLAKTVGLPHKLASSEAAELKDRFPSALDSAERKIADEGFPIVHDIASHIRSESKPKLKVLDTYKGLR